MSVYVYDWVSKNERINCYFINDDLEIDKTSFPFLPWGWLRPPPKGIIDNFVLEDMQKQSRIKFVRSTTRRKMKPLYGLQSPKEHVQIVFQNNNDMKKFRWFLTRFRNGMYTIHETNVTDVLKFITFHQVPSCGWVDIKMLADDARHQRPHRKTVDDKSPPSPVILSFDIEAYSSNPNRMPTATETKDEIFQVSCVFSRYKCKDKTKILVTMGNPDPIPGVVVVVVESERELLLKFTQLVNEYRPSIVTGYNIFGFDLPYMLDKAELRGVKDDFLKMGYMIGRAHV